jgi:hypothetical protein
MVSSTYSTKDKEARNGSSDNEAILGEQGRGSPKHGTPTSPSIIPYARPQEPREIPPAWRANLSIISFRSKLPKLPLEDSRGNPIKLSDRNSRAFNPPLDEVRPERIGVAVEAMPPTPKALTTPVAGNR